MAETQIHCIDCGRAYPESGAPYRCPDCGGLFDFSNPRTLRLSAHRPDVLSGGQAFDPAQVDSSRRGIFRFSSTLWPAPDTDATSLGEGNTPLVWADVFGRQVGFKCEYQNPTGSFKDRSSAFLMNFLRSRGVTEAVEDSSGNAGASFAAYAARAGIKARVFVPESASGPKLRQIQAYGAELIPVPGPRDNAELAARKAATEGAIYASHAHMPFSLLGYATIAYEIFEQMGERVPSAILVPAGQGGLLLGVWRGFEALKQAGVTREAPRVVGIQAAWCSPFAGHPSDGEGQTIAEGIRTTSPLRRKAVLQAVEISGGGWVTVEEKDILRGRDALAQKGFYVEPTSALVWKVLETILPDAPDPVVAILTGSGLKFFGN